MKDFTYPENLTDFSDGVDISNDEINQWIKNGIEHIKKKISEGVKDPSSSCASGNGLVTVFAYKQDNGLYTIHVNVTKNYHTSWECDVEL